MITPTIFEVKAKMNEEQLQEEINNIFKKIEDLTNVLEATANVYYFPDKMWNILLKSRDNVKIHFDKNFLTKKNQKNEKRKR